MDVEDETVDPKNRYRHRRTGDLGYIYQDSDTGELMIRYAHGPGSARVRYAERDWAPEDESIRQLHRGQLAKIAFAADQAYCTMTGRFLDRRRWEQLPDAEREAWCNPDVPPPKLKGHYDRCRGYIFVHRGYTLPKEEPRPDPVETEAKARRARAALGAQLQKSVIEWANERRDLFEKEEVALLQDWAAKLEERFDGED